MFYGHEKEYDSFESFAEAIEEYIDYYNNHEGGCWTRETARSRIEQVMTMRGAYSIIMKRMLFAALSWDITSSMTTS